MPFGLCNVLATFQRLMDKAFLAEIHYFVLVYLNDILIFSGTIEEHWDHLWQALQRLQDAQLYGRLHKCAFLKTQVDYLGFEVNAIGVHASPEKVKAVVEWSRPKASTMYGLFSGWLPIIESLSEDSIKWPSLWQSWQNQHWSGNWEMQKKEAFGFESRISDNSNAWVA